jgi:thiol-disulfide isomerase/thioredoxin
LESNSIKISIVVLALLLIGCSTANQEVKTPELVSGKWRAEMELKEGIKMPFNVSITRENETITFSFKNGEEILPTSDVVIKEDSIFVKTAIFDSEFKLKIINDSTLSGLWYNYYKSPDYAIAVTFTRGDTFRFKENAATTAQLAKKYEVTFGPGTKDEYKAIGLFEQNGTQISGSFATETGDYRFLEGQLIGETLYLSTFDGSHAFLFTAAVEDSILDGTFYSGSHYQESFSGVINDSITLKDPDLLTFLKDGYSRIYFEFENLKGDTVKLTDERFENKVVLLQIMGSWCPNCMDESIFFKQLHEQYYAEGLEVVALAFERAKTKEKSLENLNRMQEKLQLPYSILLAGETRAVNAADKLPMLNHIMSYPTSILIGKSGDILSIHTGFYGPSTGSYYDRYVENMNQKIKEALK